MTHLEQVILDIIQDEFPIEDYPYRVIADKINEIYKEKYKVSEKQIFDTIDTLFSLGVIRRIGGVYDSKKLGYISRLCAGRVPSILTGASDNQELEIFAKVVNNISSITHNYLRNHEYNVWFTIIAKSEIEIQNIISSLCNETKLCDVHILDSIKMFKINTVMVSKHSSFKCNTQGCKKSNVYDDSKTFLSDSDKNRIALLSKDIPHTLKPFLDLGIDVSLIKEDLFSKRMRRFGAVLRHQNAGFSHNAMVCFNIEPNKISKVGFVLASSLYISHCYERLPFYNFPYNIYAMVHAKSKEQLTDYISNIVKKIQDSFKSNTKAPYVILNSVRELKKTSFCFFKD